MNPFSTQTFVDFDQSHFFKLQDQAGEQFDNFAIFPNGAASQTYSFTLSTAGASFSASPVEWVIFPGQPTSSPPVTILSGETISFTVPSPHHFRPWAFLLAIDFGGVIGIKSQTLYIGRKTQGITFDLIYQPATGSFMIQGPGGTGVGLTLVSQQVLVHLAPGDFRIKLSAGGEAQFSHPAMVWSGITQPEWVTHQRLDDDPSTIEITILESAWGKTAGFRFAINVDGIQGILSPDPIIVNATIGDGTGG